MSDDMLGEEALQEAASTLPALGSSAGTNFGTSVPGLAQRGASAAPSNPQHRYATDVASSISRPLEPTSEVGRAPKRSRDAARQPAGPRLPERNRVRPKHEATVPPRRGPSRLSALGRPCIQYAGALRPCDPTPEAEQARETSGRLAASAAPSRPPAPGALRGSVISKAKQALESSGGSDHLLKRDPERDALIVQIATAREKLRISKQKSSHRRTQVDPPWEVDGTLQREYYQQIQKEVRDEEGRVRELQQKWDRKYGPE